MLKSIRTFSYLFGYLPFASIKLKEFKKQKDRLSPDEYARLVHSVPQKWAAGIMQRTKSRIEVAGLERLPDEAVLLVSNHEGNFDIPVLLSTIGKPFGFISKKEVKKFPIIPEYMEEMECVFLDRTDRRSAFRSITDTVDKLKAGHSILIFPEGSRSKGSGLGEFKAGFSRIAKDAGVPIVPIAISGTSAIMEQNGSWVKPAHVKVEVLRPFSPEELAGSDAKEMIGIVRSRIEAALNTMTIENDKGA